jgi:hypothetical protein
MEKKEVEFREYLKKRIKQLKKEIERGITVTKVGIREGES